MEGTCFSQIFEGFSVDLGVRHGAGGGGEGGAILPDSGHQSQRAISKLGLGNN